MSNEIKKKLMQKIKLQNPHRKALGEQMDEVTGELRSHGPGKNLPTSLPLPTITDLPTMAERLNVMPKLFDEMEKPQLYLAWDSANSIEKSSAWIKGHIAMTINKKFGESTIKEFAESKNLSYVTVYRYMKLAELFPKVDKILDPSYFFKAIEIAKGDNDKAVKLIEGAREKKKENPKYSVSQFAAEATSDSSKNNSIKSISTKSALSKALELAKILKNAKDLGEHEKEIEHLKKAWAWLTE
jgi:hypothetical protein